MKIRKVTIKEFALLKDLTFNLGPVNIFYGPNESGKTMIVDALIDGLFRITRVKSLFPDITRYSSIFNGEIILEDREKQYSVSTGKGLPELFNFPPFSADKIFCVRAGKATLPGDMDWWLYVKENVAGMDGGIQQIASMILSDAGLTREFTWIQDKDRNVNEKISAIDQSVQESGAYRGKAYRLLELEQEKTRLQQTMETLIDTEKNIRNASNARKYWTVVELMERENEKHGTMKELEHIEEIDLNTWVKAQREINRINEEIRQLQEHIRNLETGLAESKSRIEKSTRYLADWHSGKGKHFPDLEAKVNLIQHLEEGLGRMERTVVRALTLGGVLLLTALVMCYALWFRPYWWESYAISAFIVALVTILYWVSLSDRVENLAKLREEVNVMASKWKMNRPDIPVKRLLKVVKDEAESVEKGVSSDRETYARNTKNLEKNQTRWREYQAQLEKLSETVERVRQRTGFGSLEELQENVRLKKEVALEQSLLSDQINRELGTKGREEWDGVLRKLEPYKQYKNEELPPEIQDVYEDIRARDAALQKINTEETQLKIELEKSGLKNPEDVWMWTCDQSRKQEHFNLLRNAVKESVDVLMKLETDQEKFFMTVLTRGENSPSRMFETVTESMYRNILLKNGQLFVETHDGDVVPEKMLSSGTREQLSFCLRLSIAQKLMKEPSFLILDDPFLFCDSERLETLLYMIETTIKKGWQILYFTFDERVVRYFKRTRLDPHYFQLN